MSDRCLRLLGISIVGSVLLLATGCTNTLRELRGVNYLDYGHYDLAIEDFTEVIQHDPANAEAYYNRGTAYASKGEYDLAIADFDMAIELRHKYWQAYANRGIAYLRLNDYDRAIADLTQAMEAYPVLGLPLDTNRSDRAILYNNRARAYYGAQQYDNAWDDTEMAQRLGVKFEPDFLYELRKATGRDM